VSVQIGDFALRGLTPRHQALFRRFGAGPDAPVPYQLLHHAFEARAAERPDAVAVTHIDESMSYGELDQQADRLAALLAALGVQAGDRVGVFLERSTHMVVGILAALKAGASYVPQDVRITPAHHLDHIVRTASIQVILTLSRFADRARTSGAQIVIEVDTFLRSVTGPPRRSEAERRSTARADADSCAVVIFTSGTTGQPNGVSVTHANLCNVLLHGPATLGVGPGMRVAQLLNIAFDMAVWEIFVALSHGATLVIRGSDIAETVRAVDVVIATPSILSALDADQCRNVMVAAVAGERCPQWLADIWSSFSRFHNACGPTEVTIVNTVGTHRRDAEVTIGRPIPNTTVYILDDDLAPCPIGEVGEMWAGGMCVTAGYLANDALTRQRYRPDPFLGGEHRMFRTRDLARWTADGDLEHHGRTDDQVKVNGFRVELDAVTRAMEQAPHCRRATTVLHDGRLVGFVTPSSADPDAARRAVARSLPYYCVPSLILAVDELPATDRGKVDKSLLTAQLDRVVDAVA